MCGASRCDLKRLSPTSVRPRSVKNTAKPLATRVPARAPHLPGKGSPLRFPRPSGWDGGAAFVDYVADAKATAGQRRTNGLGAATTTAGLACRGGRLVEPRASYYI